MPLRCLFCNEDVTHEGERDLHPSMTFYICKRCGLVKLEEGPIVTAQLTDVENDQVKIGMKVEMVTRKLREDGEEGQIIYGYKFRPALSLAA